jgi:hypothetical protein
MTKMTGGSFVPISEEYTGVGWGSVGAALGVGVARQEVRSRLDATAMTENRIAASQCLRHVRNTPGLPSLT